MCVYEGGHLPARDYLAEAKRRNTHLKKLRSVSRAYRKSEVRQIKMRAVTRKEHSHDDRQGPQETARHPHQPPDTHDLGDAFAYAYAARTGYTAFTPGGSVSYAQAANASYQNYLAQAQANLATQKKMMQAQMLGMQNAYAPQPTPPLPTEIKAGEITAYRCWRIVDTADGLRLTSIAMTDRKWEPGKPMTGDPTMFSEGVHAWKTLQKAFDYMDSDDGVVLGEVELWGQVVEHEDGYRAEYASIKTLALIRSTPEVAEKLCAAYGVELGTVKEPLPRVRPFYGTIPVMDDPIPRSTDVFATVAVLSGLAAAAVMIVGGIRILVGG